jgi:DNA polymerase I-like protein with 3'-5' exonuclease and polymerase domains
MTNRRTLMNFPAQAHGAEMLRIAMILLAEAGIRVCAPVHDAVLVECAAAEAEATAETVRAIMTKAATMLLGVAPRVSIKEIRGARPFIRAIEISPNRSS